MFDSESVCGRSVGLGHDMLLRRVVGHVVRCMLCDVLVGSGGSPSRHGMTCCCDVSCGLWRLAKPSWHVVGEVSLGMSIGMAWRLAEQSDMV